MFTSVTLTGTIQSQPGNDVANAVVTLTLSHQITDGTTDITPVAQSTKADSSGAFSIAVPANDDSTTLPVGTFYTVTITSAAGATLDSFSVVVPHASAPTVDLFSLARLGSAPSPSVPFVISVNGESGIVVLEESSGSVIPSNFVPLTAPLTNGVYHASAGEFVIISDPDGSGGDVYLPPVAEAGKGAVVAWKCALVASQYLHLLPDPSDSGVTIDKYTSIVVSPTNPPAVAVVICDGNKWWTVSGYVADSGSGYGILYAG